MIGVDLFQCHAKVRLGERLGEYFYPKEGCMCPLPFRWNYKLPIREPKYLSLSESCRNSYPRIRGSLFHVKLSISDKSYVNFHIDVNCR